MKWHSELIGIIRRDFAERKEKNPRFSLRSYAQRLGLSSGSLSDLLNERRNWHISKARAAEIADRIPMSDRDRNRLLIQMDMPPRLKKAELDSESYEILTDWTYYPILFTFDLAPTHHAPAAIAKRLGISVEKVQAVIEDLLQRKLLMRNHLNELSRPETFLATTDQKPEVSTTPSGAMVRKHHELGMDLAKKALNEQSIEMRDITSLTFAGSKQQIEVMREEIRKLYAKASTLATMEQEPDTVYRMSIQLFPMEFNP